MKRILLAGATLLALTAAQPTLAADAPVYKGPPPAPAVALFNWSGFYIGGHVGGVWFRDRFDVDVGFSGILEGNGFIGGALVGYNWQFAPNWMLGIEADGGWTSASSPVNFAVPGPGDLQAKMHWDAHARARLGYAMGQVLWFIAGGVAWANFSQPTTGFGEPRVTHTGWTIGGGVDLAFWQALILRIEYLYSDYGRKTYDYTPAGGGTIDARFTTQTVRGAAILKF